MYIVWNFADDEPVKVSERWVYEYYMDAVHMLELFKFDHNDLSTRQFYSEWYDVMEFTEEYQDKFAKYMGV